MILLNQEYQQHGRYSLVVRLLLWLEDHIDSKVIGSRSWVALLLPKVLIMLALGPAAMILFRAEAFGLAAGVNGA